MFENFKKEHDNSFNLMTYENIVKDMYRIRNLHEAGVRPDYIVDIGANIGMAIEWMKSFWPEAKVIAVEPDARLMHEYLHPNTSQYKTPEEIIYIQAPFGDGKAKVKYIDTGNSVENFCIEDYQGTQTVALDGLTAGRQNYIVKIDAEGAEKYLTSESNFKYLKEAESIVGEIHFGQRHFESFEYYEALFHKLNKTHYMAELFCGQQVGHTGNFVLINKKYANYRPTNSIIIPVCNQLEQVYENFEALFKNTLESAEFIFIDNGASLDVGAYLINRSRKDSRIKYFRVPYRLSYAKAINLGWRMSSGQKNLILLDADTKIMNNSWIQQLEGGIAPGVGMTSPQGSILNPDFVTGHQYTFCALIPMHVMEEVGGIDERMVDGLEDMELSFSIQRAGYKVKSVPEGKLGTFPCWHPGHISYNREDRLKRNELNLQLIKSKYPETLSNR